MKPIVEMPKSRFIKVICKKCKNEQIIFNKPSTVVKCLNCDAEIALPTGGLTKPKGKVLRTLT